VKSKSRKWGERKREERKDRVEKGVKLENECEDLEVIYKE